MEKIDLKTTVTVFENTTELTAEDTLLMNKAIEARAKAYAPYSKFNVGAAFLLENGEIILGNNQESAAYPSGMCAERVGVWRVGSEFPGIKIKKLAITAASQNMTVDKPIGPCGACRQTLSEYEINQKEPMEVLFMGEVGKIIKTTSLLSLLPFSFDSEYL
ncbi:cytidine deaminase [Tenacibaculum finnmarkense genomovar finnmarkense]|uniref:Cytidine deaminase n=1 Tax=Tenacibaculum finnmarkense genomovar finnmarkense TaxID=1458503 RepID=A0AAP1REU5_9FLAO|nr:cytidine deaminase [Tenacibaculum finnmarkense]MBE7652727.1 cytidine deaminase [Tenacibaculum finnmarkense genomovar finnmarkense]MBE7660873.1 cytidine deaminase [Tenacibaculum finnmarkense genomovar finnmarkense]MBE7693132.1 cytidine deaminase [Tenacibaculum finnmarkense genomovar finnmarkense]MBE7694996.1 cytidine deaminase [Tenacibaculum finnmarkense genomovar finnmarkense]MCD8403371.1 cytidine deaminase [Tenacibaculum finnmarkense genomovar finnmarkense]